MIRGRIRRRIRRRRSRAVELLQLVGLWVVSLAWAVRQVRRDRAAWGDRSSRQRRRAEARRERVTAEQLERADRGPWYVRLTAWATRRAREV